MTPAVHSAWLRSIWITSLVPPSLRMYAKAPFPALMVKVYLSLAGVTTWNAPVPFCAAAQSGFCGVGQSTALTVTFGLLEPAVTLTAKIWVRSVRLDMPRAVML